MVIYWSLLTCLIGGVVYFITCVSNDPPPSVFQIRANVVALHMFWVGLLVFLLQTGGGVVGLIRR